MDVLAFFFQSIAWLLWACVQLLRALAIGSWRLLRGGVRLARRQVRQGGTHGTARFATRWEILRSGLLFGKGPVLGKGRFGRLLRFTKDGLVMVFAATGAGKGLGIVVPTLLDYPGSILVTDPKGENYAITRRRRAKFGSVRMLSPTDLMHSERYNPLDIVRAGTALEADDAAMLARYMVRPDAREPHWDDKAVSLLTALILHTLAEPPETRTLAHVRTLSVGETHTFRATLEAIARNSRSVKASEIASGLLGTLPTGDTSKAGEFESVLSNVQKATEIWSSGSAGGVLSSASTFSLDELVTGTATVYLCVDEEFLAVYDRWLRVMTGCVLSTILRAKRLAPGRRKVLLLLDEVAVLGALDPLEKQAGLLRAYCTPVLIWQHILQAISVYGPERGPAFLANASCRVFFGTNDNDTAAYVSTMIGHATVLSSSQGVSQSSDAWLRQQHQQGQNESGYWLLDPAEVQRLPVTRMIIKFRNLAFPMMTKRIDYRRRLRWAGQWDKWRASVPPQPEFRFRAETRITEMSDAMAHEPAPVRPLDQGLPPGATAA
ncbi:type IV secretory system conjugative DNA transfer family protein [Jiella pacifica]|uniref:Type IV secretory system conjugative DNA transfer family protein n=1 Tax=Jiella pacifica TaxID=2696469 RepID=A0A6N9TFZ6_9HYPH|nr:type IV secretory system conjugative DNA transfer family protein [Jiella pacifica]NDW07788.1 type IV secretory system conjugative DNA transfer family protein [Jiella pacifica]